MNPPSVFLDQTFLVAVSDGDDVNHDEAVARYRLLIDDFVEQRCLLVARNDHLPTGDNRDLFAPIDKLHVARQHRNAASELVARTGVGIDEAITLVMLHRYRIRKVASFSRHLADYDTDLKVAVPHDVARAQEMDGATTTQLAAEAG